MKIASFSLLLGLLAAACAGSTGSPPNGTAAKPPADPPGASGEGDGKASDGPGSVPSTSQTLSYVDPCTGQTCGSAPSGGKASSCTPTGATCGWSAGSDATVSYEACADAKCGAKPGASVCPSGTVFRGATCGSENGGACRWTTACVPPPSTTPCAKPNGCGGKPEIAVVCKDGTVGDLACRQQGAKCGWERTCE